MAVVIVRVRLSGQERSLGVDEDKVAEEIRFDVPADIPLRGVASTISWLLSNSFGIPGF